MLKYKKATDAGFPADVLGVRALYDGVLGVVAPLGLAAARGTALVVDLDPDGMPLPGRMSLAELVSGGPRRADLSPSRPGVAVLPNGGIDPADAAEVLAALTDGWPAVVMRCGPAAGPPIAAPVVPVIPAIGFRSEHAGPAVVQPFGPVRPTADGVVLPVARRRQIRAMLGGVIDPRWPWVRAWRQVWSRAWG